MLDYLITNKMINESYIYQYQTDECVKKRNIEIYIMKSL